MRLRSMLLPLLAGTLAASSLGAQPATGHNATLGGVPFAVPAGFSIVPALSDSAAAVYAHAPTHRWLLVATPRNPEERFTVTRRLARAIAVEAFGPAGDSAEWLLFPSDPISPFEDFRERLALVDEHQLLDLTLRQFRSGGRDVVTGSAFVLDDSQKPLALCGETTSFLASEAEAQLAASVSGQPVDPVTLLGGFAELEDTRGGGPPPPDSEVERVRAVFHAYLKALMEHNGAGAAALAAPPLLEHYAELQRLALYAAPAQVRDLPLPSRLEVLALRHSIEAGKLRSMTPLQMLSNELTSWETDGSTGSSPVVRGDIAWVNLTWEGEATPARMFFMRRDGVWRMDLLSQSLSDACELRQKLRAHGVGRSDENAFLIQALGAVSDRAPSEDIWLPLVRTGSGPE